MAILTRTSGASQKGAVAANAAFTATMPTGTTDGDLVFVAVANAGTTGPSAPSGDWTRFYSASAGSGQSLSIFRARYSASLTLSFTNSATVGAWVTQAAYSDTGDLVDYDAHLGAVATGNNANVPLGAVVTGGVDGDYELLFFAWTTAATVLTPLAGTTIDNTQANGTAISVCLGHNNTASIAALTTCPTGNTVLTGTSTRKSGVGVALRETRNVPRTATPTSASLIYTKTNTATPITVAVQVTGRRIATPVDAALTGAGRRARVTWLEFEVPLAPSGGGTRTATPITVALQRVNLQRTGTPVDAALSGRRARVTWLEFEVPAAVGLTTQTRTATPVEAVLSGGRRVATPVDAALALWRRSATVTASLQAAGRSATVTAALSVVVAPKYITAVSANSRYMLDQYGQPIFIQGDSPQCILARLTTGEMATLFSTQAGHGYNASQIHLMVNDRIGANSGGTNNAGVAPFTTMSTLSTPIEAYWTTVDTMLTSAADNGITVFASPCENISWGPTLAGMSDAQCFTFGQFIGNRYKSRPNIIWSFGNDYDSADWAARDSKYRQVLAGIRDTGDTHLVTLWLQPNQTSWDISAWDTLNGLILTYAYTPSYWEVEKAWLDGSPTAPKPAFFGEGNYEGEHLQSWGGVSTTTNETLRRTAWWAATWGGCGQFFGQHKLWLPISGWDTDLGDTAAQENWRVHALLRTLQWWKLQPDLSHTLITAGYGTHETGENVDPLSNNFATAAISTDKNLALIYVPSTRSWTLDTSVLSGSVHGTWYDPTTGNTSVATAPWTIPSTAHGDGTHDWVLLLESGTRTAPVTAALTHIAAPLRVHPGNSRYFIDGRGKVVMLAGSHTWDNEQDWGTGGTPVVFDWSAWLQMMVDRGQNFTILWHHELNWLHWGSVYTQAQWPYQRTGPGTASDGKPRFDLTQFDQSYFDRLRSRVLDLLHRDIYVMVQLFGGEDITVMRHSEDAYPFSANNNVNGIADDGAYSSQTQTSADAISDYQEDYVTRILDTLGDLPNVLYEIDEEGSTNGWTWWRPHMIDLIHSYESGGNTTFQHPVGAAASYNQTALFASNVDFGMPDDKVVGGNPGKVQINDGDHSYFGMWNDTALQNRNVVWENLCSGAGGYLFMDPWDTYISGESRNLCTNPTNGVCELPASKWDAFRTQMGYLAAYTAKVRNFALMAPDGTRASTGYALVNASASAGELLVYYPNGGSAVINLSHTSHTLNVEWLNAATGATQTGTQAGGSANQTIVSPWSTTDAVLYLYDPTPPQRTATVTASLQRGGTRTATPITTALRATATRTATPVTAALQATAQRVATPASVALAATRQRTATATVALQATATRTATPTSTALSTAVTRTATTVSAALQATSTRVATPLTVGLLATPTRTATPATVALQTPTLTRTATPLTVALLATSTRTATPLDTALSARPTRTAPNVNAALAAGSQRFASPVSAVLKQLDIVRTATPADVALQATLTRTATPATVALQGALTRTATVTVALSSGNLRVATPVTTALSTRAQSVATPVDVALQATLTRSGTATVALIYVRTRTATPVAGSLSGLNLRLAPVSAALQTLAVRTTATPITTALQTQGTRTATVTASVVFVRIATATPIAAVLLSGGVRSARVTAAFRSLTSREATPVSASLQYLVATEGHLFRVGPRPRTFVVSARPRTFTPGGAR